MTQNIDNQPDPDNLPVIARQLQFVNNYAPVI